MQPDVRYCTTSDGVQIAYTVSGSGPPFVSLIDPVVSHTALEWSNAINGPVLEEEAGFFTLVRLDQRGCGLSERTPPTTFQEGLLDLEAVVDRLGLDQFTLHANTSAVPLCIGYAAQHPERVSRLIVVDGFLRSIEFFSGPQLTALIATAANDWEMATEAIGTLAFGPGREQSRTHGAYVRQCINPGFFEATSLVGDVDVTADASSLSMPVLVIRHAGVRWITDDMTRNMMAKIPDARLVSLPGTWVDDPQVVVRRMAAFVYEGEGLPLPRWEASSGGGVRTILFTDLVGHTEMMRRLGDAAGRELLREHERLTREAIAKHGGTEIKTDGDSFMVSFASVASAVDCAIAVQRAVAAHNETHSEPLRIRMGLNAGEPIEDGGDLFGEAVILAARIAAEANEGEILVPETVRHLIAGKGHSFRDRGTFTPKGFEEEVHLYAVDWR